MQKTLIGLSIAAIVGVSAVLIFDNEIAGLQDQNISEDASLDISTLSKNTKAAKTKASSTSQDLQQDVIDEGSSEDNNSSLSVEQRIAAIGDWVDTSEFSAEDIEKAIQQEELWDFSESASPDGLPLDESEKNDGRAFFKVNPAKVVSLLPEDTMKVTIPDTDEVIELKVSDLQAQGGNLITWNGTIESFAQQPNTFTMTRGKNNYVSGHINTPHNTYSFEIFGETGWVHESGALFTGELPPLVDEEELAAAHNHSGE